jgi:phosphatidylglycerol---prolipoprotein diacylglyceryl transferase
MFPIHLNVFGHVMPFYEGFYFLFSVLVGYLYGLKRLPLQQVHVDTFINIVWFGTIGAIVFGRLSHFVFWDTGVLLQHPVEVLYVWDGGMSIAGAIFGALCGVFAYCKWAHIDFYKIAMVLAPPMLLAQAVGRVGCFLNGDAFGVPTASALGVSFPRYGIELFSFTKNLSFNSPAWLWCYNHGLVTPASMLTPSLHPTQLYEAVFDLLLVALLLYIQKVFKTVSVKIYLFLYLLGYCLFRLLVEFFRGDREGVLLYDMSSLQLVLLAVSAFLAWKVLAVVRQDS